MKPGSGRRAAIAVTCTMLAAGAAGCGSKSSVTPGSGKGRPPVTVGYRDTPEQAVLGEMYAQILREKGFSVRIKRDFASAKAIDSALRSGDIDVYPEYVGVIAQVIGRRTTHYRSAASTYKAAREVERRRGLTLLEASKYSKNTILIATSARLKKGGVFGIKGLSKKLHNDFTLGGVPELRNRYDGLVGLRRAYDVIPRFTPLPASRLYSALNAGTIDIAAVSSTDPQMLSGKYKPLGDKQKIFGFQNVAPVASKKAVTRSGPAFSAALNLVTERLGRKQIRRLNSRVQVHHETPAKAARDFVATLLDKEKPKSKRKTTTRTTTTRTTSTARTTTTTAGK